MRPDKHGPCPAKPEDLSEDGLTCPLESLVSGAMADHTRVPTDSASPLARHVKGGAKRAVFEVVPAVRSELPHVDGLLAGAAEADITPPPGLPKAGYSANAHDGNGFRTRLRARVTHLRSGRSSLAIIQLDLLGGSSVLQHLVAAAVADRTDIGLAGIWIGATHTHAGPGQFLGSDFYNHHASNRAGFDPAWTQFLVDRIAAAVIEAHDARGPARAAFASTEVWGLTRNRSHDPYVHNDTVPDKRRDPQRKWVAVNPQLHLLRVDRVVSSEPRTGSTTGTTRPLAAAVVFSIHGTGVSQHAHEYNADVWAYLVGELGNRIENDHGVRPVVGAMEGTHADVAPALRPESAGHREAGRIGRAIGAAAHELYRSMDGDLSDALELDAGLAEIELDRASSRVIDGIELPDRPAVGAALVAGAMENLTPVIHRIPPFRAGFPKRRGTDNPQRQKWVLGSRWLQPLVLPKHGFPRILSVQVFRIGPRVLVGLPFEITVEAGRRIAAAVGGQSGVGGSGEVVVSSVANEYWGYVTTPEEYSRQFYEGGHTLYGPRTLPFLAAQAGRVARATLGSGTYLDVVGARRWNLQMRRYLPQRSTGGSAPERRFEGRATFTDPTAKTDGFWEQVFQDVPPGDLDWHLPLAGVEASDDGGSTWAPALHEGRPIDDQGWAMSIAHLGEGPSGDGSHRYRVRWHDPVNRAGRMHRFVLTENADRPATVGAEFD